MSSYELFCDRCNRPTGCWVHSSTPRPLIFCDLCHEVEEADDHDDELDEDEDDIEDEEGE